MKALFALIFFPIFGLFSLNSSAAPLMNVNPQTVFFQPTPVGGPPQVQLVTIQNFGDSAITGLQIFNGCAPQVQEFSSCVGGLAAGQMCSLTLQLQASFPGQIYCQIEVIAPGLYTAPIYVSGTITSN